MLNKERFNLEVKKNGIYVSGIYDKTIKVPSQMFPLNGMLELFAPDNTEPIHDEKIREIFDCIAYRPGYCYSNAEMLKQELIDAGVAGVETYVGWMMLGISLPVHHCIVVIEDKHILDFSELKLMMGLEKPENNMLSAQAIREQLVQKIHDSKNTPAHEKCVFGQVQEGTLYMVSRCKPNEGRKIYNKLRKAYPKHPSYPDLDENNMTPTQKLYYERQPPR